MYDLSAVPLDVEEVLEELRLHWQDHPESATNPNAFTKVDDKGSNIMLCCPFHAERKPSFGIMTEYPYGYQCFGCECTGNLAGLAAHVLQLPGELQGIQYLVREFLNAAPEARPALDIEAIIDGTDASKRRSLPDSEASKYREQGHPVYMIKRGFTPRTLDKYEIGYDADRRAVTIPVRTSKGLLRFVKRRMIDRKMFLNDKDIFKKDIVYGLCYIKQAQTPIAEIYLNESETDTMSCYQGGYPAGATLGKILHGEQVRELMLAGIKTVNLFFDNDPYGVIAALRSYRTISKMSAIRINVVLYPGLRWGIDTLDKDAIEHKDANDLLCKGLIRQITTVPFTTYLSMLKVSEQDIDDFIRGKGDKG